MTPILFGLSKDEWDAFNVIGTWLSAVASFGAVLVALYLANRANKPSAMVSVTSVVVLHGPGRPIHKFLMFRIVNSGDRVLKIEQITWRIGIFKRVRALQTFDHALASPLPVELSHGQKAEWLVPFDAAADDSWAYDFAKGIIIPAGRSPLSSLRAQFHTTLGHVFSARPCGVTMNALRAALLRLRK